MGRCRWLPYLEPSWGTGCLCGTSIARAGRATLEGACKQGGSTDHWGQVLKVVAVESKAFLLALLHCPQDEGREPLCQEPRGQLAQGVLYRLCARPSCGSTPMKQSFGWDLQESAREKLTFWLKEEQDWLECKEPFLEI